MGSSLGLFGSSPLPRQAKYPVRDLVPADVPWDAQDESIFEGASPAVEDQDLAAAVRTVDPDGYSLLINPDGTMVIDSGGDPARQSFNVDLYDRTVLDWTGDTTFWINNQSPVAEELDPAALLQNVAMTAITLASFITDADDSLDTLVLTVSPDTVNALPTGVSIATEQVLVGENNLTIASLEGTPTTVSSGTTKLRITDPTGAYVETDWQWAVVATSTIPDVEGLTQAAAISALTAENLNYQVFPTYDDTVPAGKVIAQDPAAGLVVAEGSVITMTVSLGPQPVATGGGMSFAFGFGFGVH